MNRLSDWPERLQTFFDARSGASFAWGPNDCVSFARGAVQAMTGAVVDLPTWASEAEARDVLALRGGLVSAVSAFLGSVEPKMAQRGDLTLMRLDGVEWLAVSDGTHGLSPGTSGTVRAPLRLAVRAWRVGEE